MQPAKRLALLLSRKKVWLRRIGLFAVALVALITVPPTVLSLDLLCGLRIKLDDLAFDRRSHCVRCEELPTPSEVEQVISEHEDVLRQIQQFAFVEVSPRYCSATGDLRADIAMAHISSRDRIAVEKIIDGDTFFGVPY